ncbi:MAG: hypothetical protein AB7K24_18010 [Gemmataceae bacterium]
MRSPFAIALAALVVYVSTLPSADEKPEAKPEHSPNEVKVRFADGSVVNMLLLQDFLEVSTRYGKLRVPVNEVQKIDFGLHYPDGLETRINTLITKLGSENFKDRETAIDELVGQGVYAFPILEASRKHKDVEIARNVEIALQRLREKLPAEKLEVGRQDVLVTPTFTIAGHIETPLIKARTAYFGDMQLKVTDLRGIVWLGAGGGEAEVVVDAIKYGGINTNEWMDAGITVESGVNLTLNASGQVDLRPDIPGRFMTGPKGMLNNNFGGNGPHPPGALLGKIGESGTVFVVGEKYTAKNDKKGKLYLRISPSPYENCSGAYNVKIKAGY